MWSVALAALLLTAGCEQVIVGEPNTGGQPDDTDDTNDQSNDPNDLPGEGADQPPPPPQEPEPLPGDPDKPIEPPDTQLGGMTVEQALTQFCTTSAVKGLADQLIAEISCVQPDTLARIDTIAGVTLEAEMRPYLQKTAAAALAQAAKTTAVQLNSGLRTLPQQYMLYQWMQRDLCPGVVTVAALPGKSTHESGLALDSKNYSAAKAALEAKGFVWSGTSDPVHFGYATGTDLRSLGVRAFQRLYNLNNAAAPISVDGLYGPQTAGAVSRSPAVGFQTRSTCTAARTTAVDLHWTSLGGDRVAVRATAPDEAREVELWVGGTQVGVIEVTAAGELLETVVTVPVGGRQLLEAVAVDGNGSVLGRGLNYLAPIDPPAVNE